MEVPPLSPETSRRREASIPLPISARDRDEQAEVSHLAGLAEAKPEAFHRFLQVWMPRVYTFLIERL